MAILSLLGISMLMLMSRVEPDGGKAVSDPITKISSSSSKLQMEGAEELKQQRQQLIGKLLAIIQQTNTETNNTKLSSRQIAIQALGEMRATEAASTLAQFMNQPRMGNSVIVDQLVAPSERYPAVKSLVQIGIQALPAVIKTLTASAKNDELTLNNSGWILLQVLGAKVSKVYLQEAINAEKDASKRMRLATLLNHIQ